jgi:uncharacterized spore protein YtfJ
MSEIIKSSLNGIKDFTDMENAIGTPIQTPSGVTVIPVSRVSVGFATGGLDYGAKKLVGNQNFGGGGGTGVSITPIAFLTAAGIASKILLLKPVTVRTMKIKPSIRVNNMQLA